MYKIIEQSRLSKRYKTKRKIIRSDFGSSSMVSYRSWRIFKLKSLIMNVLKKIIIPHYQKKVMKQQEYTRKLNQIKNGVIDVN